MGIPNHLLKLEGLLDPFYKWEPKVYTLNSLVEGYTMIMTDLETNAGPLTPSPLPTFSTSSAHPPNCCLVAFSQSFPLREATAFHS